MVTVKDVKNMTDEELGVVLWSGLAHHAGSIRRIADEGPNGSDEDKAIVRTVCLTILDEIRRRLLGKPY